MSLDPAKINKAVRHIRDADPIMRKLIRKAGPFRIKLHRDRFQALVYSIIAQQISGKAASSIRARLANFIHPERISPETLARLSRKQLRSVGVSPQKSTYLIDLAEHVTSGKLRLERIGRVSDDEVIEALVQVKGIGVWTAQMFLIFSLGRLDIFPHQDLGVRMAIRNLYGLEDLPDREVSHRIATP